MLAAPSAPAAPSVDGPASTRTVPCRRAGPTGDGPLSVLHLTGSTVDAFHANLSCLYHEAVVQPRGVTHAQLHHAPDGRWSYRAPRDNGLRAIDWSHVAHAAREHDLVVPHMFCPTGMTVMRGLFEELLGVPVVGPPQRCTTLMLGKWDAQAIAQAAGVRCPPAVRLRTANATVPFAPPFIVKPDGADNSLGLSLVRHADDARVALERALAQDDTVIAQHYVAGREFRVGVLEWDGPDAVDGLRVLPALEYHVSPERPIRTLRDKLDVQDDDTIEPTRWSAPTIGSSCPARMDEALAAQLAEAVRTLHRAFGARDYSLYDFRVDAQGRAWLLEPCTFWSFSTRSILSFMVEADAQLDLEEVVLRLWRRAAARRHGAGDHPVAQVSRAARAAEREQRILDEQNRPSTFE